MNLRSTLAALMASYVAVQKSLGLGWSEDWPEMERGSNGSAHRIGTSVEYCLSGCEGQPKDRRQPFVENVWIRLIGGLGVHERAHDLCPHHDA